VACWCAADAKVTLERVRGVIEAQWPPGGDSIEALGDDPALWRRW